MYVPVPPSKWDTWFGGSWWWHVDWLKRTALSIWWQDRLKRRSFVEMRFLFGLITWQLFKRNDYTTFCFKEMALVILDSYYYEGVLWREFI